MGSIDDRLTDDETIIGRTKCHYAIFGGPFLLIFLSGLALQSQGWHAAALMVFGFVWGTLAYLSFVRTEIGLTQTRLVLNAGFPLVRSFDIPLNKIVAIDFGQPALGALLNFGKLVIESDERRRWVFRFVAAPAPFVAQVRQQIAELRPS